MFSLTTWSTMMDGVTWATIGLVAVAIVGGTYKVLYGLNQRITDSNVERLEADKKITEEMSEIKMNYLDRFKELNQNVTAGHIKILEKIEEINVKIASRE